MAFLEYLKARKWQNPLHLMSVKSRISLICGTILIGCFVLFIAVYTGDQSVQKANALAEQYEQAADIADELNRILATVRIDKNILAQNYNEEIYIRAEKSLAKTIGQIGNLIDINIYFKREDLKKLESEFFELNKHFRFYVNQYRINGFSNNFGDRKNLIKAGTTLSTFIELQYEKSTEEIIRTINGIVSRLRRIEQDYILTGSERSYNAFNLNMVMLNSNVNKLDENGGLKEGLQNLIAYYFKRFEKFHKSKNTLKERAITFETSLQKLIPRINALSSKAQELSHIERNNLLNYQTRSGHFVYGILTFATLISLILASMISLSIIKPLRVLRYRMDAITKGELDQSVEKFPGQNELSSMAHSLEIFRHNAKEIKRLEQDKQRASRERDEERKRMIAELNERFGSVVDAALKGDFSQRVTDDFANNHLNMLGHSINRLMSGFDQGMSALSSVIEKLSKGHVSARMEGEFEGAFCDLQKNIAIMSDALCALMSDIAMASNMMRNATNEILSGANDLSRRSSEQADTLKKTSLAAEDLANFVRSNTEKVQSADDQATQTRNVAEQSRHIVSDMVQSIQNIEKSSQSIDAIVSIMEDIAFQTNLLALNASVEAARAGDHGRGFAIVAEEVRRLAQSASSSSEDIRKLILQTQGDITQGVNLAEKTRTALDQALGQVSQVSNIMQTISEDSTAQSSRFDHINSSIRDLDVTTQKNVTLVEETNAAVQSTLSQAERLDALVSAFKTEQREEDLQQSA